MRGTLKIAPRGSRFSGTIIGDYTRFDGAAQATKFIYANPAGLPAPLNNLSRALANLCSNGLASSAGCAATPANDSLDNYAGGSIHDGASAAPQGPFQANDRYNDLYSRVTAWGVALNLEYAF